MVRVSIVMPLYNAADFVAEAIVSVQRQSLSDWELIIVDDGSTDKSVEIALDYSIKDPRVRLIRLAENSGAAVARNTAIEAAKGRFIAFLDSDDLWKPDKLEVQVSFMESKGVAFSYTAYDRVDFKGDTVGAVGVPARVSYNSLLKCCVIGCLAAMYDTHELGKVYMPLIRKRQDFGLWLRLLKQVDFAYGIQQPLALYRVRGDSISAKKSSAAAYTWRIYREVEGLGFVKSLYYFGHYSLRGLLRHKFPAFARLIGVLN